MSFQHDRLITSLCYAIQKGAAPSGTGIGKKLNCSRLQIEGNNNCTWKKDHVTDIDPLKLKNSPFIACILNTFNNSLEIENAFKKYIKESCSQCCD